MARHRKKVLCPVDFSVASLAALTYAADFARQEEGPLILMQVVRTALCPVFTIRQMRAARGERA